MEGPVHLALAVVGHRTESDPATPAALRVQGVLIQRQTEPAPATLTRWKLGLCSVQTRQGWLWTVRNCSGRMLLALMVSRIECGSLLSQFLPHTGHSPPGATGRHSPSEQPPRTPPVP